MENTSNNAGSHSGGRGLRVRSFDDIFGEMQRSFGDWMRPVFPEFGPFGPWASDTRMPRLDIKETEKEYDVTVELPGISKEDITVEVSEDNTVEISGKKTEEKSDSKQNYLKRERSERSFHRCFTLPVEIEQDGIEAHVDNGILSLKLPKKAEAPRKAKKVEVK